jgi:hypothetical protein
MCTISVKSILININNDDYIPESNSKKNNNNNNNNEELNMIINFT